MKKRIIRDNACYEIDLECLKKKEKMKKRKEDEKRDKGIVYVNKKGT